MRASFLAERLGRAGHATAVHDAAGRPWPDPAGFGAVLLVGALDMARLPASLRRYVRAYREALNGVPHPVSPGQDYDLTDYDSLAAFAEQFVVEAAA